MDKIIPRSIHYADLKPEAIEHTVKLVRFLPANSNSNWQPGQTIPFKLHGNGFYDPYSAYLNIRFEFSSGSEFEYLMKPAEYYGVCHLNLSNRVSMRNVANATSSIYTSDYSIINESEALPHSSLKYGCMLSVDNVSTQLGCYLLTPKARPGCEFKMLDRSAHSLISQLTVKSQSTELERIDEYDVLAAMINDTIYSNEQAQLHAYEGFGGSVLNHPSKSTISRLVRDMLPFSAGGPRGRVGEVIWGWAFVACDQLDESHHVYDISQQGKLDTYHPTQSCFYVILPTHPDGFLSHSHQFIGTYFAIVDAQGNYNGANIVVGDLSYTSIMMSQFLASDLLQVDPPFWQGQFVGAANLANISAELTQNTLLHDGGNGQLNTKAQITTQQSMLSYAGLKNFRKGAYHYAEFGTQTAEFVIPLYSGSIGVLMPDKKLIPLSLLPIDVEFKLNPYAVLAGSSNTFGSNLTRGYTVSKFELHVHMIFFEQEVHRALESVVAEHGIFFHIKSFYKAPDTTHSNKIVNQTIPINVHFKSINSVHFVFLYSEYQRNFSARKLHFVSHNLRSIQIRNGTDMIPNEPIQFDETSRYTVKTANQDRTLASGRQGKMFIENMKSWNRMHDPTTDAALESGICWIGDQYAAINTNLASDFFFDLPKDGMIMPSFDYRKLTVNGSTLEACNAIALSDVNQRSMFNQSSFLWFNGLALTRDDRLVKMRTSGAILTAGHHVTTTPYAANLNGTFASFADGVKLQNAGSESWFDFMYSSMEDYWFHKVYGQYGANPHKIPLRPSVFFTSTYKPVQLTANIIASVQNAQFPYWYIFGMSAEWLTERIQQFQALTGRCQYSIGLEGINLGSDLGILSGKKGMTPFDLNVMSPGKDDDVSSISVVFCKYDAVIYVRADLVVQVLGK